MAPHIGEIIISCLNCVCLRNWTARETDQHSDIMPKKINLHNYLVLDICLKQLQNYGVLGTLKEEVARQKNKAAIDVFKKEIMRHATYRPNVPFHASIFIASPIIWNETPQGFRYWRDCATAIAKLYSPFQLEKSTYERISQTGM